MEISHLKVSAKVKPMQMLKRPMVTAQKIKLTIVFRVLMILFYGFYGRYPMIISDQDFEDTLYQELCVN